MELKSSVGCRTNLGCMRPGPGATIDDELDFFSDGGGQLEIMNLNIEVDMIWLDTMMLGES